MQIWVSWCNFLLMWVNWCILLINCGILVRIGVNWWKLMHIEMSRWYGFDTREKSRWYGYDPSWEVKMVWFWSLVRSQDGMVWIPREKSRWYGFGPSWGVEMVWFWSLVRRMVWLANLVRCRRLRDYISKRLYGLDSSWEVGLILVPREKSSPGGLPRET